MEQKVPLIADFTEAVRFTGGSLMAALEFNPKTAEYRAWIGSVDELLEVSPPTKCKSVADEMFIAYKEVARQLAFTKLDCNEVSDSDD
jgi:hypothetical protein